jgi:alpha-1,6-mannosyl-glycoprotein beta-1,2-N-acetylglucosaminyltransferase
MGMALNRSTWLEIKSCAEKFCSLDDYNWDWSLQFISENCVKNKLNVLVADGPRIFHIGEWCESF